MTNEELVNTVCPILNDNGWKYYFTPNAIEVGKSMGLKGMEFYVAGRGGSLGDCDGSVVAAAFGYFNPVIIGAAWSLATAKQPARVIGDAHYEVAAHLGREKLTNMTGLNEFTAAMEKVFNAADADGLALFAVIQVHAACRRHTSACDATCCIAPRVPWISTPHCHSRSWPHFQASTLRKASK